MGLMVKVTEFVSLFHVLLIIWEDIFSNTNRTFLPATVGQFVGYEAFFFLKEHPTPKQSNTGKKP